MKVKIKLIKIDAGANKIINKLQDCGYEAYVVGGCIRDSLLGKTPKDWDICTNALPEQILEVFKGYKVIPTGLQHGTVTIMLNNVGYEITTYRIDGEYLDNRHPEKVIFTSHIEDDLSRRDFTINAMAYNQINGLVDPFDGTIDLANKTIRSVGDARERFQEDTLRMMRAIRLICQLGFNICPSTNFGIIQNKELINNVSKERIRDELCKILVSNQPSRGIILLKETGLLQEILPEVQKLVNFDQNNPNHDKDVFDHTMAVLNHTSNNLIVRLSALLHDIGKPDTFSVDDKEVGHFYHHHVEGKIITEQILRRLKFDNETIKDVCILVREHMSRYSKLRCKSIKKFINRVGIKNLDNLFELQFADISGSKAPHDFSNIYEIKERVKEILNQKQPLTVKDLAVTGYDLMGIGIEPGKKMGEILDYLLEQVLSNPELNTKEQLLNTIKP